MRRFKNESRHLAREGEYFVKADKIRLTGETHWARSWQLESRYLPLLGCEVSVTFAPTEAIRYSDTLMINDNLEPNFAQTVTLMGVGKALK